MTSWSWPKNSRLTTTASPSWWGVTRTRSGRNMTSTLPLWRVAKVPTAVSTCPLPAVAETKSASPRKPATHGSDGTRYSSGGVAT